MKKRFRIIAIAFCISFITVISLSFYSLKQFSSLVDFADKVDHTNKVIAELYKIQDAIKEFDIKERGYLLTKDKAYIDTLDRCYRSIYYSIVHLGRLSTDNETQKHTLVMLKSALVLRMENLKNSIANADTAKSSVLSTYFYQGIDRKSESLNYINAMLSRENALLKERSKSRVYFQYVASSTLKYLILIFCIITIVLFILIISELRKRMQSEQELQTRLIDLENSHGELQQIAFAASHDLQEPLRKIKIFGDRLLWMQKDQPDKEMLDGILRINAAANQVQELVTEVVSLTSLVNDNQPKQPVDLNPIVQHIVTEMDDRIRAKNAIVIVEKLPEIKGYESQLFILFKNLLDNALKFSRDKIPPLISIRADVVTGSQLPSAGKQFADKKYYCITVSDNGIGFENKYIDKIFLVFQRLQDKSSIYQGKGVGLAICKRVMVNHTGFITANGHPGMGATFKLYFPAD